MNLTLTPHCYSCRFVMRGKPDHTPLKN